MDIIEVNKFIDNDKLFDILDKKIKNKEEVVLDFTKVYMIDTHFACNSIGKLFAKYTVDEISNKIHIKNIHRDDAGILKMAIRRQQKRAT